MSKWKAEWKAVPLGQLAEFRNGINYNSSNKGKGIKVVGVGNFQNRAEVPYDDLDEINPDGVIRADDLLKENDFVFVRSNGNRELIGRSLFVRNLSEEITHSGFTIRLRFTSDEVYPDFFAHIFRSSTFRDVVTHLGSGTNISNLSQQILGSAEVPLPGISEQHQITEILGTWDHAIRLTEALIEALQRRKKALMRRLLWGEHRFPEFADEWETVKFSELFERVRRRNSSGCDNVLTISAQQGLVSQNRFFNKNVASQSLDRYYLLKHGEFAYNKSYSNGYPFGAIKRLDDYDEGVLSPLYICFRLLDGLADSDYFKYFFDAGGLDEGIYSIAQEGARNHGLLNISIDDFFNLPIAVPAIYEQRRIAAFFSALDVQLDAYSDLRDRYSLQKQGLMQKLLTGEIPIQTPEA